MSHCSQHLHSQAAAGILAGMEANSVSPDGNYKLETDSTEFRMSHWVDRPRVTDTHTGEIILNLSGTEWDMMNYAWKEDGRLWMELRRYPGDCESVAIYLHMAEHRVIGPFFECTVKDVLRLLDKFYQEHKYP